MARLIRLCTNAAAILFVWTPLALAQVPPPPNDTCAGAEIIPGIGPFPWVTTLITNLSGATTNGDPPAPSECINAPEALSRSVWYVFTPVTSGLYTISVTNTPLKVGDTAMAIYTSSGNCGGPFTEYACNDDAGGDHRQAGIATNFSAGTTYYIVVWAYFFEPFDSPTAVQLRVTKPVPPPNDLCAGAWVIPGAAQFPYLTPTNDIFAATTTNDPPTPSCLDGQLFRSVWYKYTPANPGIYTFSTCSRVTGTLVIDTFMAIYRSSSDCAGPLTEVACNNNNNSCGSRAALTVPLNAATTYFIVVWDFESTPIVGETALQLRVEPQFPPVITYWESRPEGFYLQFTGTENQNYAILASADLANWEAIGSAIWLGGELYEFTDSPTGLPHRFYRVQWP